MSAGDPRAELASLVAGLRAHLGSAARGGSYAVLGGTSPRPAIDAAASAAAADDAASAAAGDDAANDDRAFAAPDADVAPGRAPEDLAAVRADLGDCQRCKLSATRQNIVFGVGARDAPIFFVGEAPGAEEDRRGEPFVGAAGQLLDRMIEAMGWTRDSVYIANVLKCRPPGNRDPEPDEVASCEPFLGRQIAAVRPRVIVTLGKPAAHLVLGTRAPISALRGRFQDYRGIKVMPTFHPAFLLRKPERKRETWSDLKQVMAELDRLGVRPG